MAKFVTLLVLFFGLAGCLPTKPEDLRKASTPKYEIIVKEDSKKLASLLKQRMELCHVYPAVVQDLPNRIVEYTQLADSHFISFIAGFTYLIDIEVSPIQPDKSKITIGYFSTWESSAHAVKKWLTEDWNECKAGEKAIGRNTLLTQQNKFTIKVEQRYQDITALISNNLIRCWDVRIPFMKQGAHRVDTLVSKTDQAFITMKNDASETYYSLAIDINKETAKSSTVNIYASPEYLNEVNAIKSLIKTGTYSCGNGTSDDTLLQDIIRTMPIS